MEGKWIKDCKWRVNSTWSCTVTEFLEGCAAAEEKATMKRPKLAKETKVKKRKEKKERDINRD